MAKTNIQFLDCDDDMCAEVNALEHYDIIKIHLHDLCDLSGACIHLDKSTAIKFAKTLRTEINKIQ